MRKTTFYIAVIAALALSWTTHTVSAQSPDSTPMAPAVENQSAEDIADSSGSFLEILSAGGVVGMFIMLLSIAAAALVIEHIITIRESVLMPPGLGAEVRDLLVAGQVASARQRCRQDPSFLAFVLEAGLAESDSDWPQIEKAAEDAAADQSARLLRKIEYLSVIGNIAPMLGLLGTVIGMIFAFREVAGTQGAARAAALAEGIYLALVPTVEGLIVAIPSLAAFAVFRNRVDQLSAEASYVVQHTLAPLKRGQGADRTPSVPSPRTPPSSGPGPSPSGPTPPPVGGR